MYSTGPSLRCDWKSGWGSRKFIRRIRCLVFLFTLFFWFVINVDNTKYYSTERPVARFRKSAELCSLAVVNPDPAVKSSRGYTMWHCNLLLDLNPWSGFAIVLWNKLFKICLCCNSRWTELLKDLPTLVTNLSLKVTESWNWKVVKIETSRGCHLWLVCSGKDGSIIPLLWQPAVLRHIPQTTSMQWQSRIYTAAQPHLILTSTVWCSGTEETLPYRSF